MLIVFNMGSSYHTDNYVEFSLLATSKAPDLKEAKKT